MSLRGSRFLILVCAVLVAASAQSATNEKPNDRLAAIEARVGGHLGVAAFDPRTGKRIEYRAHERFLMCSTFKFLAAAAVLKRVDGKEEQLDRFISYGPEQILEYAPVTKEHLKEGGMTLGALCEAAIEQSDNTAANLMLETISGPAGLTRFARTLGDDLTRLDRNEPDLNNASPGDDRDTTTPAAMLEDMRQVLTANILAPSSRELLENWMVENKTGDSLIRAGVPAGWRVGDKTGRGANGATNDIAILRPPQVGPVLLTIYSTGSTASAEDRSAAVAEAARVVVESL